ncbi:unnamed protein product [Penicillium egyptiacum]|uniref:Uncharacterized protein n=1 Tax=Penicillium egyptiacum TaxID=1303716 RepID=A0A9W4K5Q1_9EURO|nr:unnamed protein product [Penicillium egyptiacum]
MASILSAHEIGKGLPVVIIHGCQMEGRVEEPDFEPIFTKTAGFHRIYADLPGMGTTPANNAKDLNDIYLRLDIMRDLNAFRPLVANEQLMSDVSDEDRSLLGDLLVQTPAYVQALEAKYENVYLPAEKAADAQVLDSIRGDSIRGDSIRYQLSCTLDNESAKFFAPTLIMWWARRERGLSSQSSLAGALSKINLCCSGSCWA